jgi:hypothetical protein
MPDGAIARFLYEDLLIDLYSVTPLQVHSILEIDWIT